MRPPYAALTVYSQHSGHCRLKPDALGFHPVSPRRVRRSTCAPAVPPPFTTSSRFWARAGSLSVHHEREDGRSARLARAMASTTACRQDLAKSPVHRKPADETCRQRRMTRQASCLFGRQFSEGNACREGVIDGDFAVGIKRYEAVADPATHILTGCVRRQVFPGSDLGECLWRTCAAPSSQQARQRPCGARRRFIVVTDGDKRGGIASWCVRAVRPHPSDCPEQ